MYVTDPAKTLRRALPLIMLLTVLALLRAEQGVAELDGRAGEPSRLFHLAQEPRGDAWDVSLLGRTVQVPSRIVLVNTGGPLLDRSLAPVLQQIKQALP